jgi:hypothetical protein
LSKDENRRITNTYLESGEMGILIDLDDRDLRDGAVSGCETGVGEVGRLEFGQSLLVEFRLEILEDGSESWTGKKGGLPSMIHPLTLRINYYSPRTSMVPASTVRLSGAADTMRGATRTEAKRTDVEKRIF